MKERLYIELLDRLETAHRAGYHHEACWHAHAIIAERTTSILDNSGDTTGSDTEKEERLKTILDGLFEKIATEITDKSVPDERIGKRKRNHMERKSRTYKRGLYTDILRWEMDRIHLEPDFKSGTISFKQVDGLIAELSERGLDLCKKLCAAAPHKGSYD